MQRARKLLSFLILSMGVLISTQALATVVQVDGTIVPVLNDNDDCSAGGGDKDIQTCLDNRENITSLPDPDRVDAIQDAATEPETFFAPRDPNNPDQFLTVDFEDVAEGAGFENSFGYYNIGDDVTNYANLHPILGASVPRGTNETATQHGSGPEGAAAGYIQDTEPGDTTTVDFQTEFDAGRYKGGAIGFYLVTPEGNEAGNGCGDFKEQSDGDDCFGRIYFTQRDLNNDGDFVHHIVYQSKKDENRFYFGFEDLFRGGDNDFEDMFIHVTGLVAPCIPSA